MTVLWLCHFDLYIGCLVARSIIPHVRFVGVIVARILLNVGRQALPQVRFNYIRRHSSEAETNLRTTREEGWCCQHCDTALSVGLNLRAQTCYTFTFFPCDWRERRGTGLE